GTPAGGGFADAGSGYPYVITLDPANASYTQGTVNGRMAHEMGHEIGIGNATGCDSIMDTSNPDGSRNVNTIKPNDVVMSNKNLDPNTRTSDCTGQRHLGQDLYEPGEDGGGS